MNAIPGFPLDKARQLLERQLRDRALADAGFRALLISDPHAAMVELLGVDPVPGLKIRVVEEDAGEAILVLPRYLGQDELPDDLLDFASGGAYKGCKGDSWTQDKLARMGID